MNKNNKSKLIIIHLLLLIINIFVVYNLKTLYSVHESNVNKKWQHWIEAKEKHLNLLETNVLISNHYVGSDFNHFYEIKIMKKANEVVKNDDVIGIDNNGCQVDVYMGIPEPIFINENNPYGDIPMLSKSGNNKMKYVISYMKIKSPTRLKDILIKGKSYKDTLTKDIIDKYKNSLNSLIKEDFEFNEKDIKSSNRLTYIVLSIGIIVINNLMYSIIYTIFDVDIENKKYNLYCCIFNIINIIIYVSFIIINL